MGNRGGFITQVIYDGLTGQPHRQACPTAAPVFLPELHFCFWYNFECYGHKVLTNYKGTKEE
jgi:G:T-mismatch repair DNA endonuclease (very short patch repair protein)